MHVGGLTGSRRPQSAPGTIAHARQRTLSAATLFAYLFAALVLGYSGRSTAQSTFADSRCVFNAIGLSTVGTSPFAVAAGDLNGDTIPDIATANEGSNNVSILLGTGAGAFAVATPWPAGIAPRAVLLVDVSADGKRDLVVANSGSNTVSIRLGNGAGSFGSASDLGVGSAPRALAVADLDKDGKPDLVVANAGSNNISVLIASGGGILRRRGESQWRGHRRFQCRWQP